MYTVAVFAHWLRRDEVRRDTNDLYSLGYGLSRSWLDAIYVHDFPDHSMVGQRFACRRYETVSVCRDAMVIADAVVIYGEPESEETFAYDHMRAMAYARAGVALEKRVVMIGCAEAPDGVVSVGTWDECRDVIVAGFPENGEWTGGAKVLDDFVRGEPRLERMQG